MHTTPASLLDQLRQPAAAAAAWERLVRLYTPLLYYWVRRAGASSESAGDVVQDVLTVLVQKLPQFAYDPRRSFRNWLRTITLNKWREQVRRRQPAGLRPQDLDDASLAVPDGALTFAGDEYRRYVVRRALQLMQSEFQPSTWKACWELVVSGRPAAAVAAELGLSEGAVYVAKCRVLRRLRQELAGLLV
jgi:RNA polymerase sigma-70 factor (ECF subfamily)